MMTIDEMTIEALLEKPYWIVDVFPMQVPADSPGQFFAVEEYFLREPRIGEIRQKYLRLLLKWNCYDDLYVSADCAETWTKNPDPALLEEWVLRKGCLPGGTVHVLAEKGGTMAVLQAEDLSMTVYNPSEECLGLLRKLAEREGLFVWKPQNEG